MKTYRSFLPSQQRRAFSLVEVLVVIAIIAVLAAVSFPVAGKVMKSADIEKNRVIVKALDSAITEFYSDYNYLPSEANSDTKLSNIETINMLRELAGQRKERNTKGKNYLKGIPTAKNDRNGIRYGSGDDIDGFFCSFGGDVYVILDGDYDGEIRKPAGVPSSAKDIRGRKALIWTLGEEEDDDSAVVMSWK
ncbi:type II secretion system protein [Rubritalea marina]|uniref:type II secretion system protein n=1 Tax=Rubritalea marina TaxID=361055 RepID=UPI000367C5E9|nr:type II secretion system protein [Rubritalea marina]